MDYLHCSTREFCSGSQCTLVSEQLSNLNSLLSGCRSFGSQVMGCQTWVGYLKMNPALLTRWVLLLGNLNMQLVLSVSFSFPFKSHTSVVLVSAGPTTSTDISRCIPQHQYRTQGQFLLLKSCLLIMHTTCPWLRSNP
jgi:hypothetical protein